MTLDPFAAYLPTDRRHALARGVELPTHTTGAALFADIAGFTPLTEALLNTLGPQRGAEELTRHLNTVFAALIAEVDRYHGSVLGFAGDAITCWFAGALAPATHRAVTCGLAMQTAMHPFAALPLATGATVVLAMKVAVAAGPARRFVVGDPNIQRIDVLAGATLDRMAAIEKHAERGEVMVDADTLTHLGLRAQVGRTEGNYTTLTGLTRRARQQPWPALEAEALTAATLRAWLLPPIYARLREGQAQFLAEMRSTVALFLSFGGLDYDTDPDAQHQLDTFIRRVQQLLDEQEASLLQLTVGDKGCYLYAAFGAPLAHDDDPRRAIVTARALQALVQEFDFIRDLRIGLNQGRVWSGAYGGPTRYTYGALGDMVNVAARLMSHAAPGAILISPTLAKALEAHYELRALGAVALKGKAQPLPIYQVVRPLAQATQALHGLIGREVELAQLAAHWQTALQGHGQIVRVLGAPGMGKSHLVREFSIELANDDAWVSVGMGRATEQASAYRPWRALVWRWLNLPDEIADPATQAHAAQTALIALNAAWHLRAPLLGDVLDLPLPDNPATAALDPKVRHEAVAALVIDLLRALAQQHPLLIWLDDVQYLDEASIALTLAVSRALAESRALLLCTQAIEAQAAADPFAEWETWPIYHALPLAPVGAAALTRIIEQQLEGPVQALPLALIQQQAQGNVFYARELVEALREAGHLVPRADGTWHLAERLFTLLQQQHSLMRDPEQGWWTLAPDAAFSAEALGLPDSLQRAITARIDQLSPETQLTAKIASVVGAVFEVEVLERAHPHGLTRVAVEAHLAEATRRGLVQRVEHAARRTYRFDHPLIHEGIYHALVADQQLDLHGAVGAALEALHPEAVEALAHHFSRSRVRGKAVTYLGQAAEKAQRSYANETALRYYEQALGLEARWAWRKAQVEILHMLARREAEWAALKNLEASSPAPAFEVAYLMGQYYESVSDYANAQTALELAHTLARGRADTVNESNSLTQLGLVAYRRGQAEAARTWFEQARAVFAAHTPALPAAARALAQANNGVGLALLQQGQLGEAIACFQRALELYRQSGDQRGEGQSLNNLGMVAYTQRNFAGARMAHQRALELRRAIGDRSGQGSSLINLAQATREAGDYLRAQDHLQAALRIQRETGNRWDEANTENDLGILHLELGQLAQAETHLQRSLNLCAQIGDDSGVAYARANLGLALGDAGQLPAALAQLEQSWRAAREQDNQQLEAICASYLGDVLHRLGRWAEAKTWATRALTTRRDQWQSLQAIDDLATLALSALAEGEAATALEYARQTAEALRACQGEGPEFPQRAYWACFTVFAAHEQTAEARAALHAAHAWVLARANNITDPELRRSFLENVPRNWVVVAAMQRTRSS